MALLGRVAAEYAGEAVIVRLRPFQRTLGIAYSMDGVYRIDLADSLKVGELTPVFFHEVGHLACGHVQHGGCEEPGDLEDYWLQVDTTEEGSIERAIARRIAEHVDGYRANVYPLLPDELEAWEWGIGAMRAWQREHGFFAKAAYSIYEG